ncbi:unnamed protein product [Camellia sinensis]
MHLEFNKSFQIIFIFIIFSVLANETLSVDPNFEACMPRNCGNGPNISYPFWITNLHESYCGQPNFEITCNGGNPVVTISDDDYVIEEIFYTNNSFLLPNSMVYDFENTCPILLHNFSIEGTSYDYSLSYVDLFFFYNCSTYPINKPTYRVDCASNATDLSFAVFHKDVLEYENYLIDSCNSWVNAPVETGDIKKLLEMNFTDVLRRGFVLQWSEDYCSDCKRSGGNCGSINNKFTCFCSDKQHSKTCDDEAWGRVGTLLMVAIVLIIYCRRNKKYNATWSWISRYTSHTSSMNDIEKEASCYGVQTFCYNELQKATNNFDSKKEIGDGGFGTVYLGKLQDGSVVAVKRLYEHNFKTVEQFMNEIEILTRLRHPNLVSLYRCTSRHCHEPLLICRGFFGNGETRSLLGAGDEVLEVLKEINSVGYDKKVADEMDIPADDVVLLKSDPPTLSPNSLR